MDVLLLIILFSGVVELVWGNSLAKVSELPVFKDSTSHGTQYRFQYFVRDERGDYKTQEEAGEGGNARGSYAVEEPDGDLRIVQYTADIGGGFKAHIKVDHGGKSPPKLEEIDIPADEMRKIIESNRKKTAVIENEDSAIDKSSKSYVLGPPKKISDIVMEQAAAIREIISKEIEADKRREMAEEKMRNELNKGKGVKNNDENEERIVEVLKNSQILNKNIENDKNNEQSTVVRVVSLNPRNIEGVTTEKSSEKSRASLIKNNREISVTNNEGTVRNFSFKNRIMFFKPVEKKSNQIADQDSIIDKDIIKNDSKSVETTNQREILLYSPPYGVDDKNHDNKNDDRKGRYVAVPYDILRPYLNEFEKRDENGNK